ncbi:PAS domain-containing protein [Kordiimonas sp. SCSIO 12610]|uniref:PAS domain-containing protein n=1 Tax=Kordiimonas sp. SCSIO 12610 TaxID=2829597 RepID=UPI00210D40B6|nr:PAS domain-containing protein [Kordiimonas sp. SCSIO 12610]UTW55651.1 PAS domain-containing protein [Kordiimonas sp. SCSIO 12610]
MSRPSKNLFVESNKLIRGPLTKLNSSDIEELHPVSEFYRHWHNIKNDSALLNREKFSPMAIPRVLPWIIVFDHEGNTTNNFSYRLAGEEIIGLIGADPTGKFFGYELLDAERHNQEKYLLEVCETRLPVILRAEFTPPGRQEQSIIIGLFPLSLNGEKVDQVYTVLAPVTERIASNELRKL